MPISHAFVSAKPDSTDPTKIKASNWNENHVIDIFVDDETPLGLINGINTTFTLAFVPSPVQSLQIFRNAILMYRNTAYSITGNIINFSTDYIPEVGDLLRAWYRKA